MVAYLWKAMSGAGQRVHCCHAELHRKSSCYAVEYRSFVDQGVVVDQGVPLLTSVPLLTGVPLWTGVPLLTAVPLWRVMQLWTRCHIFDILMHLSMIRGLHGVQIWWGRSWCHFPPFAEQLQSGT